MWHFDIDFLFFEIFQSVLFLKKIFSDSIVAGSISSIFSSLCKLFELYVRTCPAMFFYFNVKIFVTTI